MERERVTADQVEQVLGHLFSGLSVFHAEICKWLVDADVGQQFLADGAPDLVRWVSARFGLRHSTAAQLVRVARKLQDLPVLRSRFGAGELSLDQTDAISKLATADNEAAVIEECAGLSNAALDRAGRRSRPPSSDQVDESWRRRELFIQRSLDGVEGTLFPRLPGAELHQVEAAIRERADRVPPNPETGVFDPYPVRMADVLVELCTAEDDTGADSAARVQITVHADLEALTADSETTGVAELQAGPVIANVTARRLSCDGLVERTVYDHARTLGIGRRSRLIPAWLRRQLWRRNGGCQFPGCGTRNWVQAHHIAHWADGGTTDLFNLILLCGRHHRFLHEAGWWISHDAQDRIRFHKPDGAIYPPAPPPFHPRLQDLDRTT